MKLNALLLLLLPLTASLLAEDTLPTQQEIYAGILKSQGGNAALAKIKSMRIQGEIQTTEETIPFTLIRKKPNLVRLALNYPKGTYVIAYNGDIAWSHRGNAPYKDIRLLSGEQAENFKLNAPFFGYLIETERYQTQIKSIEWNTWDDKQLIKVSLTTNNSDSIEY